MLLKKIGKLLLMVSAIVAFIFLISYVIEVIWGYNLPDVAFIIALITFVVGLFSLMQGNTFRNRIPFPENEHDTTNTILELQRESLDIQSQGSRRYVLRNRLVDFSFKRTLLLISGISTILIINLLY